jgi:SAM-dependent methyltransferase
VQIPPNEIKLHPASLVDQNGRLFEWRGALYRAVSSQNAPFVQSLFSRGVIDQLYNRGLVVQTEIEPLELEGYDLILKHRRITFVSYAYEWTPSMLKDAAISLLDVNLELARFGLTSQDAHPWNVLYDGPDPVFVDVGSIVPVKHTNPWPPTEEFHRFFLRPLIAFSQGERKITRWILHDHLGITSEDLTRVTHPMIPPRFPEAVRIFGEATMRACLHRMRQRKDFYKAVRSARNLVIPRRSLPDTDNLPLSVQLEKLKEKVCRLELPQASTLWSDYYSRTSYPSFEDPGEWTPKHKSVSDILKELRPKTVLDIASNRGWHSRMAARLGSEVAAFDTDEPSLELLYGDLKRQRAAVLPVVMDILRPSAGFGWLGRGWALPATTRFQCDMVLALAIIHHLAYKSSIPAGLDHIVALLSVYAKRWMLIEFIPPEDQYVSQWHNQSYGWYNLDNLTRVLEKEFRIVRQMPSHPELRTLLLCERKS